MKSKVYCFVLIFWGMICFSQAASVKGIVSDKTTQEPIIGATVVLKEATLGAASGLDGSFTIKNIAKGSYTLSVSYVGYQTESKQFTIENDNDIISIDFQITENSQLLKEVVISGGEDKTTDEYAARSVQNSLQLTNVVSAKTIEVSPDLTVANVLQRVSGVTIERNQNGDGQHAIIRGMEKRYNYTLVNGIKIPSPDNKNRYIPLDIFPSDLLDRLEVSKSLTPNMEGDAIGGVMNMVMKDAPNRFLLNANAGTGYGQLYFDRAYTSFPRNGLQAESPQERFGSGYVAKPADFFADAHNYKQVQPSPNAILGFSIGNRFLNNKLGAIVAASYQSTYRGSDSKLFEVETQTTDNSTKLTGITVRNFSARQIRSGVHTKLDYKLNEANKLSFFGSYINLQDVQTRVSYDTNLVISRDGAGTGRGSNSFRSRLESQNIYNATLQGDHKIVANVLKLQWSLAYSLATYANPEQSEIETTWGRVKDPISNAIVQEQPLFEQGIRRWQRNSDQDRALYVNLSYSPEFLGRKIEFSTGGLQRFKNRENYFNRYELRPDPSPQAYNGDNLTSYSYFVFNPTGTTSNAYNYTSYENVTGLYGMGKWQTTRLQIIAGARNEITSFGWQSEASRETVGRTGSIAYSNLLPSAHFKYMPDKKRNIRGSYFASISRPGFFEVIPYIDKNEDYTEAGNPLLKHTQADNFDLRYEFFPKPLNQFLAGVFYKAIRNPIEYAFVERGANIVLQPGNFGTATNYGFELDFAQYLRVFGIRANYTFTNSSITTSKTVRFTETNPDGSTNQRSRQENQTRPLQGQSMHNGNISLLLKEQKTGFDAQLALVYTGRRIVQVSNFKDGDFWQKAFTQLDFSAEKRIKKYFTVYVKVNNILNTPYEVEIPQKYVAESSLVQAPYQTEGENILIQKDYFGQMYFAGMRFKL